MALNKIARQGKIVSYPVGVELSNWYSKVKKTKFLTHSANFLANVANIMGFPFYDFWGELFRLLLLVGMDSSVKNLESDEQRHHFCELIATRRRARRSFNLCDVSIPFLADHSMHLNIRR